MLVSPHRTQRPWQGEVSQTDTTPPVHYDPDCYLCPGNVRAGGQHNPQYTGVFAFVNDYAALLPDSPAVVAETGNGLLRAESERGVCRVLCFHPDHSLTLAGMEVADIVRVVEAWTAEFVEFGARPEIRHVQIFENRGAMMGASNPHPHGQIWATEHIPDEPVAELANQRAYSPAARFLPALRHPQGRTGAAPRIVCENQEFVVLVPFWAVWPFETLVLSRAPPGEHGCIQPRAATRAGGYPEAVDHALRPFVRHQLPLHHGLSSASDGWRGASGMAFSRSLLSALAAFGDGAQIHGGL